MEIGAIPESREMRTALKANQESKNNEPQNHNPDCNPSYYPKHGPLPTDGEDAPIEEDCAQLHTSKRIVGQHVEGDPTLGRY